MRLLLATVVCASIGFGVLPAEAHAQAAAAAPSTVEPPGTDAEAVDRAEEAWGRGGWAEVRDVLEPVAAHPARLKDQRLREKALCLLADATVNDTDLDAEERSQQAASYLERILESDPGWRLTAGIYSPELFELFVKVQDRRSQQTSAQCEADRDACRADLAYAQADLEELKLRYEELEQRFADQEVEVRDRVARSRALAAIPGGVGHFYNGDLGLGAGFLATEAALGGAGLGLILYRTLADGCRRERGFQRGSLVCSNTSGVVRRRISEEVLGWVLIGSVAIDILVAQLRFRPFRTESVERVPRRKLDGDDKDDTSSDGRRRRRDRPAKPRAKVRPTGGGSRDGFNLGVSVRF